MNANEKATKLIKSLGYTPVSVDMGAKAMIVDFGADEAQGRKFAKDFGKTRSVELEQDELGWTVLVDLE